MKSVVNISRILVGVLFIFSGLVKAIDPRGLGYKMQEFFEAWSHAGFMRSTFLSLNDYALPLSIFLITLEVIVGIALLVGFKPKFTGVVLLLLMITFTFLTSYVLFSGKIKACGCFGDCIPLTPQQTFSKDIVLLLLSLLLLWKHALIRPLFSERLNKLIVFLGLLLTLFLQWYVLKYLPLVDCLPYQVGNNIVEGRKMPANAVQDEFDYKFIYEKDGEKKSFEVSALPDSTWTFVDREQVLVKKGSNNVPLINDFTLVHGTDGDVTEQLLNSNATYYILFMRDVPSNTASWVEDFKNLASKKSTTAVYVSTASRKATTDFLQKNNIIVTAILGTDATAIKTAARANPTLYKMEGAVIKGKWSWADIEEVIKK